MTTEKNNILHAMLVLEDELEELRGAPQTPKVDARYRLVVEMLNSLALDLQALERVSADE